MDGLQKALLELEYAFADFATWRESVPAPSTETGELEQVLSRVVELARFADMLIQGLRVEA